MPIHESIKDAEFRQAVGLLDAGDESGLRALLRLHPDLALRRVEFEGSSYFAHPALLEFAAENPIRRGTLPGNIVEMAKAIVEAGADSRSIGETLALVSSGRVPRECGAQIPLIELLCESGADPNEAMHAALGHGEFAAAEELLRRGAKLDLSAAAALGRAQDAGMLMAPSGADDRHRALAWAAQFGHGEIVRMLLEAGEDPSRYNPPGCYPHSTPLHQAALAGHFDIVRMLVEAGARTDRKDLRFEGTPAGWAEYGGHPEISEFLKARSH